MVVSRVYERRPSDSETRHHKTPRASWEKEDTSWEEAVAGEKVDLVGGAVAASGGDALRKVHDLLAASGGDALGKAAEAFTHVARPGGLPFVLFLLLVAVLALRALLFRIETRRILKAHQTHTSGGAQAPTVRQHED